MIHLHWTRDPESATLTYVVWDGVTRDAIVIDPVFDGDGVAAIQRAVAGLDLRVGWVLETHPHADHRTAAFALRRGWPGARVGVGAGFKLLAGGAGIPADRFFNDGETFTAGPIGGRVLFTPGHTPACVTYVIGDAVFTGDALMVPSSGTGRCDFTGGSAAALFESIAKKLYALPASTRVYPAHDYAANASELEFGRPLRVHFERNTHLRLGTSRAEFVQFREMRDRGLAPPKNLEPSLAWNLGPHDI